MLRKNVRTNRWKDCDWSVSLDFKALPDKCGYHKTKRLTLKESVFKIVLEICKKVV